jgi:hypothetical protein
MRVKGINISYKRICAFQINTEKTFMSGAFREMPIQTKMKILPIY